MFIKGFIISAAVFLAALAPDAASAAVIADGNGGVTITTPSLAQLLFPRMYGVQYCVDPNGIPYRYYADGHIEYDGYEPGYEGPVVYETVVIDGRRVRQRREGNGFHNGRRIVARTSSGRIARAGDRRTPPEGGVNRANARRGEQVQGADGTRTKSRRGEQAERTNAAGRQGDGTRNPGVARQGDRTVNQGGARQGGGMGNQGAARQGNPKAAQTVNQPANQPANPNPNKPNKKNGGG